MARIQAKQAGDIKTDTATNHDGIVGDTIQTLGSGGRFKAGTDEHLKSLIESQAKQIERLEAMVRKVSDIDRVNKFDKSENKVEKKKCRLSYFHDEVIIGLDIIGWRPMAGQSGMKEHQYKVTTLVEGEPKTYEVYLGEYVEWVTSKRLSDEAVTYHDIEEIKPKTLILDYFGDKIEVSNKVINM